MRRLNRIAVLILITLLAIAVLGCHQELRRPAGTQKEEDMRYLLSLHEHQRMMSWVHELTSDSYGGREAGTEHEEMAGDYIIELLQSFGLKPWEDAGLSEYRQDFSLPASESISHNILAVLPGQEQDKYLLVGAHYDHIGIIDGIIHPGADDNAVGAAAVLELARIFSQSGFVPRMNIVFVLFGAEEKGLIGSGVLAKHLKENKFNKKIVLLNMDVIAGIHGNTLVIYDSGYKGNKTWAKVAKAEAEASGVNASISNRLAGGVDSMSFSAAYMPAISLVWGDLLEEHPHLHSPSDTFENLNPNIVEAATKAAIRIAWAFAN